MNEPSPINLDDPYANENLAEFPGLIPSLLLTILTGLCLLISSGFLWSLEHSRLASEVRQGIALIVILASFLPALFVGLKQDRTWKGMTAFRPVPACEWGAFLLILLGLFFLVVLFEYPGRIPLMDNRLAYLQVRSARSLGPLVLFLGGPLTAEVFCRAFLIPGLRRQYGITLAIFFSALVFCLLDIGPRIPMISFLLGLLFGWIFCRTGSTLPLLMGNALLNGLALPPISTSRYEFFYSGFSIRFIQTIVGVLLVFLGIWVMARVTHRKFITTKADDRIERPRPRAALVIGTVLLLIPFLFAGLDLLRPWLRSRFENLPETSAGSPNQVCSPTGVAAYLEGLRLYERQQYPKAWACFVRAGETQVPRGFYRAGLMCMDGIGIAKDAERAASFFATALEGSDGKLPEAAWKLAWLYQQGQGVPKDESLAGQLREFALGLDVNSLDPESTEYLAGLWEDGKTGRKDLGLAIRLLDRIGKTEKADLLLVRGSEQADSEALYMQGLYLIGDMQRPGFPMDRSKGEECLKRASDSGHSEASYRLYMLLASNHKEGSEEPEAVRYLQRAAEAQNPYPPSMRAWGEYLVASGSEDKRSGELGISFLKRAGESGVEAAYPVLGRIYETGIKTTPDLLKAAENYLEGSRFPKAREVILKSIKEKRTGATLLMAKLYMRQYKVSAALDMLRDAQKQGEIGAYTLAGSIEIGELGTEKNNFQDAVLLLLKGAEKGETTAACILARHSFLDSNAKGSLLPSQKSNLIRLLQIGNQKGDIETKVVLARYWLTEEPITRAKEAMEICEDILKDPAKYPHKKDVSDLLAKAATFMQMPNSGFEQPERARRYAQAAAAMNNRQGWSILHDIYASGRGATKDSVRAAYCLCRANRIQKGMDPHRPIRWWEDPQSPRETDGSEGESPEEGE